MLNTIQSNSNDDHEQRQFSNSQNKQRVYKQFKTFSKTKKEESIRIHKEENLLKHLSNQSSLKNKEDLR